MTNEHLIIFGISGEPLQNAHLEVYSSLCTAYPDATVKIMPNGLPTHKAGRMDLAHKQAMYKHFIENIKRQDDDKSLQFELCQLKGEAASRAFDTLTYLHQQRPNTNITYALGIDTFMQFDEIWFNWKKIPGLCDFIILAREGYDVAQFQQKLKELNNEINKEDLMPIKAVLFNPKARLLSSSECVKKLEQGEDCSDDIPAPCLEYIYTHPDIFPDNKIIKPT